MTTKSIAETTKRVLMKTIFALGLIMSTVAHASGSQFEQNAPAISDFDRGRCEILGFNAEETCVELVCGDTDRLAIDECRESGEIAMVMRSCHPQIFEEAVLSYNRRASQSPVNCTGFKYVPKFR